MDDFSDPQPRETTLYTLTGRQPIRRWFPQRHILWPDFKPFRHPSDPERGHSIEWSQYRMGAPLLLEKARTNRAFIEICYEWLKDAIMDMMNLNSRIGIGKFWYPCEYHQRKFHKDNLSDGSMDFLSCLQFVGIPLEHFRHMDSDHYDFAELANICHGDIVYSAFEKLDSATALPQLYRFVYHQGVDALIYCRPLRHCVAVSVMPPDLCPFFQRPVFGSKIIIHCHTRCVSSFGFIESDETIIQTYFCQSMLGFPSPMNSSPTFRFQSYQWDEFFYDIWDIPTSCRQEVMFKKKAYPSFKLASERRIIYESRIRFSRVMFWLLMFSYRGIPLFSLPMELLEVIAFHLVLDPWPHLPCSS